MLMNFWPSLRLDPPKIQENLRKISVGIPLGINECTDRKLAAHAMARTINQNQSSNGLPSLQFIASFLGRGRVVGKT
jgi:hypothetical protein